MGGVDDKISVDGILRCTGSPRMYVCQGLRLAVVNVDYSSVQIDREVG